MLFNLVHFPNQTIKEDVAKLLMIQSDDFDDQNSLLELQKINPAKSNFDEFRVNFNEEPSKSQKQILKLVRLFHQNVQTRSQYLKQINKAMEKDEKPDEEIIVPNIEQEEVRAIVQQDCEERASLLFETFSRLTSVVYDFESMVSIMKKEDVEQSTIETVAHMMFISLVYIHSMKSQIVVNNNG
jgi:hypothetical protein